MNLPNKLTMLRIVMIPLFLLFFFVEAIPHNFLWALITFAAAALTDLIDGKIARSRGLITDFGKLMDPLADKLLTTAAFCCLLANILSTPVIISFILILSREFFVTSIRLLAAGKGEVLAADMWGKVKTVLQMAWICLELFGYAVLANVDYEFEPDWVFNAAIIYQNVLFVLFYLMVAVTVISGVHYFIKNRSLFADM